MTGDLSEAFEKLKSEMYIKHMGCLIEKTSGKFKVFGVKFDTEKQAKDEIDRVHKILDNVRTGR